MNERINDKVKEIEMFLEELNPFIPSTLEEYIQDLGIKAICERYFEKIIEAVADLALIFIKDNNLRPPETEKEIFDTFVKTGIISHDLAKRLSDAKGMRNFLSHQYNKINDELVFHAVKEELFDDVTAFIDAIQKNIK